MLSIVSPVYGCASCLTSLVEQIQHVAYRLEIQYEIILVEDCSPDESWNSLQSICQRNHNVKAIKLSRNFGQHHAITAGLDASIGEWIVVMDCDLQDRPGEIFNLYNKALEGYDIVLAQRVLRKDSFQKKLSSQLFYKIFNWLSGLQQDHSVANFGIYSRKVIDTLNAMREPLRAFAPMVRWVGFKHAYLNVTHDVRSEGKSSYNWNKLIKLALDICLAYSDKPLRLVTLTGIGISTVSFIIALYYLFQYLSGSILVAGFASLIISIWFLGGLIIFILGVIGLYIGKTFEAVKNRPLYIIQDKLNF